MYIKKFVAHYLQLQVLFIILRLSRYKEHASGESRSHYAVSRNIRCIVDTHKIVCGVLCLILISVLQVGYLLLCYTFKSDFRLICVM